MADYACSIVVLWLVEGVLSVLAVIGLILLAWWIHVSFRNRRARRSLMTLAAVILVAVFAVVIAISVYQSPDKILRRTGAVPSLASLKLTHGKQRDRLESGEVWLRFRISPSDLDALLESEPYARLQCRNVNFEAYRPPSWWNYERFGTNPVFYQCNSGKMLPGTRYDGCRKDIVVNQERNEALFLMQCWHKE